MIPGAENSQDLLSAARRTRKVQPRSKGPMPGAPMAQLKQRKQIRPSLAFLFYLDP